MTHDNELILLQQKSIDKNHLESRLRELQNQRRIYDREIISLQVAYQMEQEDVEKLEGKSLANYFFHVVGALDKKLDKERMQAYAAKVKLDAAEQEMAGIEQDIQRIYAQLSEIREAEAQYKKALEEKRVKLHTDGTPAAKQLMELEGKVIFAEAQKKEIVEALSAGQSALAVADRILSELSDAKSWNTWDMIGGGGIITHMAKHSHLDEAQELVQELQSKLRCFKTELADIHIHAEHQVNIDGFLRFADYFFDGIFADWAVGDRINQSLSSVESTKIQISQTLARLKDMERMTEQEINGLKFQLDDLIVKA